MSELAPRRLYDRPVSIHHGYPYGAKLQAAEVAAQAEADRLMGEIGGPPWWELDRIEAQERRAAREAAWNPWKEAAE